MPIVATTENSFDRWEHSVPYAVFLKVGRQNKKLNHQAKKPFGKHNFFMTVYFEPIAGFYKLMRLWLFIQEETFFPSENQLCVRALTKTMKTITQLMNKNNVYNTAPGVSPNC